MRPKPKVKSWCQQQDQLVTRMVNANGKRWRQISSELFRVYGCNKSGRQCRQRWYNHLNPEVVKKQWSSEEEDIIFQQYQKVGSKWTKIAQRLQGRSQNTVKNHFYSMIRKILRRISKLVGTKNGTAVIRKIKPSVLTKLFSIMEQKTTGPNGTGTEKQQLKQSIGNFLRISRRKAYDNKLQLTQLDYQCFNSILRQLEKTNQQYERRGVRKRQGKMSGQSGSDQSDQGSSSFEQQFKPNKRIQKQLQFNKQLRKKEKTMVKSQIQSQSNQNVQQLKTQNDKLKQQDIQNSPKLQNHYDKQEIMPVNFMVQKAFCDYKVKLQAIQQGQFINTNLVKVEERNQQILQIPIANRSENENKQKISYSSQQLQNKITSLKQQIKKQIREQIRSIFESLFKPGNLMVVPSSTLYTVCQKCINCSKQTSTDLFKE